MTEAETKMSTLLIKLLFHLFVNWLGKSKFQKTVNYDQHLRFTWVFFVLSKFRQCKFNLVINVSSPFQSIICTKLYNLASALTTLVSNHFDRRPSVLNNIHSVYIKQKGKKQCLGTDNCLKWSISWQSFLRTKETRIWPWARNMNNLPLLSCMHRNQPNIPQNTHWRRRWRWRQATCKTKAMLPPAEGKGNGHLLSIHHVPGAVLDPFTSETLSKPHKVNTPLRVVASCHCSHCTEASSLLSALQWVPEQEDPHPQPHSLNS